MPSTHFICGGRARSRPRWRPLSCPLIETRSPVRGPCSTTTRPVNTSRSGRVTEPFWRAIGTSQLSDRSPMPLGLERAASKGRSRVAPRPFALFQRQR